MVHTRNQPGGDSSPAVSGHSTTTTGGFVPATSCSAVTSSVTAAGDAITTGSKTAAGGLLSSRLGGTFAVTSPPSGNGHFSGSATATPRTRVSSLDVGTSPFGQTALESASANPVSIHDREPSVTGPGRLFGAGAYFGPSDRATLLLPPLRPNYLGDYGRMHTEYVPSHARDTSDLFRLQKRTQTKGSWDTLLYPRASDHSPGPASTWSQPAAENISPGETNLRCPVRPTARMCHTMVDMRPHHVRMMHGCRNVPDR